MTEEAILHTPPHSESLELSLLATCFVGGGEVLHDIVDMIDPEYFYLKKHRLMFEAVVDISNRAESADLVTVVELLKSQGKLDSAGGVSYIADVIDNPISVDVEYSCKKLEEKFLLRKTIERCYATIKRCHGSQDEFDEVLDYFVESAHIVADGSKAGDPVTGMKELAMEASDVYDERLAQKKIVTGVPTGINDLDMLMFGLHPGDLNLLAARPAMGKTALALKIATHAAKLGHGVLIHSLEMPKQQLFDRMIAADAKIDGRKVRIGNFTKKEFRLVNESVGKLYELPIFIDDRGGLQFSEVKKTIRRQAKLHPEIKLVIIDHIQLIRGNTKQGRNIEVGEISMGLKSLAKEIGRPILALSQLNRDLERRNNPYRRPVLADLRDSGSLEQDADNVIFIYRPWVYGDDIDPKDGKTQIEIHETDCELIVAKQRQGPPGMAPCQFYADIQTFVGETKISPDELYQQALKKRESNDEKGNDIKSLQTGQ